MLNERYTVAHTGQCDYGIYDAEAGSSPIACGMSESMARKVVAALELAEAIRLNDYYNTNSYFPPTIDAKLAAYRKATGGSDDS